MKTHYFVPVGEQNTRSGELSAEGVERAVVASRILGKVLVDDPPLILSSTGRTAQRTAKIIAAGLHGNVGYDQRLYTGGISPRWINDLDEFLDVSVQRLQEQGLPYGPSQPLVVVTHAPLVAAIRRLPAQHNARLGISEVIPYTEHTWVQPSPLRPLV